MTKFLATKYGKILDCNLYNWDEKTRTFSSKEDCLFVDFSNINNVTIKVGSFCIVKTSYQCSIITGSHCTIRPGNRCIIKTKGKCVIIRKDLFEVITPEDNETIQLNMYGIPGYKTIEKLENNKVLFKRLLKQVFSL